MPEGETVMKRRGDHEPNGQFISSIRGLYYILNFLGLWPQTKSSNWYNWYNSIWYIQSIGLVFELFGPAAGLILSRHDARKLIDNLGLVVPLAGVCVKWAAFSARRRTFNKLLYSMDEDWANLEKHTSISYNVPDSKQIMGTYSRLTNIFFYNNVFLNTLAIANYVRDSFGARNSGSNHTDLDQLLPMPNSWYPLDYNQTLNIQFLVVTQTITSATTMLANAAMDSMFIAVTLHLCGQFKILRPLFLLTIRFYKGVFYTCSWGALSISSWRITRHVWEIRGFYYPVIRCYVETITFDSSRPECCKTDVRLMVKRHQELLSAGDRIQETFSFLVLEQLMGGVLSVCFIGYEVLAGIENDGESATSLLKTGFLFLTVVQLIFSYCFVGDSLINQSIGIAIGVYNAEWYNCTRSINLSFSIVIIRARKPVQITGAKIVPMSLDSFTGIMKTAVSYLSVLRAISIEEG